MDAGSGPRGVPEAASSRGPERDGLAKKYDGLAQMGGLSVNFRRALLANHSSETELRRT